MTHVKGRRVYLSGPMTGKNDWNKDAFFDASNYLMSECHASPALYNPAWFVDGIKSLGHKYAMCFSLENLCKIETEDGLTPYQYFDVLVSLPGWQWSFGACLERTVAEACGIEVCDLEDVVA
jgi:hypothetical protein